jgi:hypothetical protein
MIQSLNGLGSGCRSGGLLWIRWWTFQLKLKAGKPQVTVEYWAFLPPIRNVRGLYRGSESCNADYDSPCDFLQDHHTVFTLYAYSKWDHVSRIFCSSLFANHCSTILSAIDSIVQYCVNHWTRKVLRNTLTLITQRSVIKQTRRTHKCTQGFGEATRRKEGIWKT